MVAGDGTVYLPQVAEDDTPRSMDVAGEGSLYYEVKQDACKMAGITQP
jgi:hypothetical protein